jgi:hypothetical protein
MPYEAVANGAVTALQAPVRNRYFYGKLMDVRHFEMEQRYFLEQRRLMNRLAHGAGVVAGLEVEALADGKVGVRPGLAFDHRGREILVTSPYCIEHALQPTDECGRPDGEPITDGWVTLELCYHECDAEPAPVLVSDCDTRLDCAPSAVRERFRLRLRRGVPERRPHGLSAEECAAVFPPDPTDDFNRRLVACETLMRPFPTGSEECVVLATIAPPGEGERVVVDQCSYRTTTYSNAMLFDLLLCLAARVDACCREVLPITVTRIAAVWPSNATVLSPEHPADWLASWVEEPRIELTFDRSVDEGRLQASDPWLRLAVVTPPEADGKAFAARLPLELDRVDEATVLGVPGFSAIYRITGERIKGLIDAITNPPGTHVPPPINLRFVLQLRADDTATDLLDLGSPQRLVDPDYAGTPLSAAVLEELWAVDEAGAEVSNDAWTVLSDSGADVPSGDGDEGGRFHSFFGLTTAREPIDEPPVIVAHWPPNGARLVRDEPGDPGEWFRLWLEKEGWIELTFDRQMDETKLDDPDPWLRVWRLEWMDVGTDAMRLQAVKLKPTYKGPQPSTLGAHGETVGYHLDEPHQRPLRYLVLIRSGNGSIVDRGDHALELDADFNGIDGDRNLLDEIWETIDASGPVDQAVWGEASDESLPSGDGQEGGSFDLIFEIGSD